MVTQKQTNYANNIQHEVRRAHIEVERWIGAGVLPDHCRWKKTGVLNQEKGTVSKLGQWTYEGNSEEARTINSYMKVLDAKVFDSYRELIAQGKPITADGLKNSFQGIKEGEQTLLGLIDYHNTQLKGRLSGER